MLLRYLSDDRNMMQFKRMGAIVGGFAMLFIMTMTVALCAMERKTPAQGLYVGLSIAACLWLEVAIVLAVHYSTRIWPAVLIYVTLSVYVAVGGTLIISNAWIVSFYWMCVSITIVGGVIEIIRRDIRNYVTAKQMAVDRRQI